MIDTRPWCVVLALLLLASPARAEEETESEEPETAIVLSTDLVFGANPRAVSSLLGGKLRHTYNREEDDPLWDGLYVEAGLTLSPNPAWFQAAVHVEWSPIAVLRLRLQYDVYAYFGAFDALLSFPFRRARFGDHERDDLLDDREQSEVGQRLMVQPTLRLKLGPVVIRNQTDITWWFLAGRGPYLLELEYDTLLNEDRDELIANRTQLLFEVWSGEGEAKFLLGPQYEMVHAVDARITRQRVGVLAYFVPVDELWVLDRPRIYLWAGLTFQDRNRDDEAFLVAGVGFDLDLD